MTIHSLLPFFILISSPLYAALHNTSNPPSYPPIDNSVKILFDTAEEEDLPALKNLIDKEGRDINAEYQQDCCSPYTLLEFAIKNDKIRSALYLASHEKINTTNRYYLHMLCRRKKMTSEALQLFKKLLDTGIDINNKDNQGDTLLHLACLHGNKDLCDFLLTKKNIQVNVKKEDSHQTPLHYACQAAELDIVKTLLSRNDIEANAMSSKDETPLYLAFNSYIEFLDYYHVCTKPVNSENLLAVVVRYEEVIDFLIEHHATDKLQLSQCLILAYRTRKRCIGKAARKDYMQIFLHKHPTIINELIGEKKRQTLLHFVCRGEPNISSIKKILCTPRISPNVKDDSKETALVTIIHSFSPSVMAINALLTHKNADLPLLLNSLDRNGHPPVITAYKRMQGNIDRSIKVQLREIIKYLLYQEWVDIILIHSLMRNSEVRSLTDDPLLISIEALIGDVRCFAISAFANKGRYHLLCAGYLRKLGGRPIRLHPLLSTLLPFVKKNPLEYFQSLPSGAYL